MVALGNLCSQLNSQLPHQAVIVPSVDIDLQLTPPSQPGWSRRPDLVVVERPAYDRVNGEGGVLRASEVRLVVELVSPGSRRMDHVIKRGEYADAGIGHYWIIDLDPPVSMSACHLAGELGYADDGEITGTYTARAPYPLTVLLDQLAPLSAS